MLLLADHGQTTVGGRGENKKKKRDENEWRGELAREGVSEKKTK